MVAPETIVSVSEMIAALGLDPDAADELLNGPLAVEMDGLLTVRHLVACVASMELRHLDPAVVVSIARVAATDAQTHEPARLLGVRFEGDQPIASWLSGGMPPTATRAVLCLPADFWLSEMTARVAAQRAAASRLN